MKRFKEKVIEKPKLRTYMLFKDNCVKEYYLCQYLSRYKRSLLCQIRFGILPIMIECGRFQNKKDELTGKIRKMHVNERICPLCRNDDVENEIHFVMVCTTYAIPRMILFNIVLVENNNFSHLNIEDQFIYLFKNHNKNLSNFIADAWNIRRRILFKSTLTS